MIKKLLSVFCLLSLVFSLVSCGGDTPVEINEAEFLPKAAELFERAETLNGFFFEEEGMPLRPAGFSSGKYKEVDLSQMKKLGFEDLAAVKAENASVFSEREARFNEEYVFSPENLSEAGFSETRYQRYFIYRNPGNEDDENNGKILAYTGNSDYLSDKVEIHTDTIRIVSAVKSGKTGETIVTVTADESVTSGEKTQRQTALEFRFVLEGGEWRLDTSVALVYNEN